VTRSRPRTGSETPHRKKGPIHQPKVRDNRRQIENAGEVKCWRPSQKGRPDHRQLRETSSRKRRTGTRLQTIETNLAGTGGALLQPSERGVKKKEENQGTGRFSGSKFSGRGNLWRIPEDTGRARVEVMLPHEPVQGTRRDGNDPRNLRDSPVTERGAPIRGNNWSLTAETSPDTDIEKPASSSS